MIDKAKLDQACAVEIDEITDATAKAFLEHVRDHHRRDVPTPIEVFRTAVTGGFGLGFELGLRIALMDPLGADGILGIILDDAEDAESLTGDARDFLSRVVA